MPRNDPEVGPLFSLRHALLRALQVRGLQRSRVVYNSFDGKISDNPRAVFEALETEPELEHIWTTSASGPLPPSTEKVRYVRWGSTAHYRALTTAGAVVSNVESPPWLKPDPDRIYIQTWHGTPLKRVGFDIIDKSTYAARYLPQLQEDAAKWSCLIAQNPHSAEVLPAALGFSGPVLTTGYPRADRLVTAGPDDRSRLRRQLGLPAGARLVLYAPTFRDRDFRRRTVSSLPLDLDKVAAGLPASSVLALRLHPAMRGDLDLRPSPNVVDVSGVEDMRDLLCVADVLVTDYSSSMFDFAVTGRPIVLHVPDLDEYRDQSRGMYLDIEQIAPGPLVFDDAELLDVLSDPRCAQDLGRYQSFRHRFCRLDDGHAADRVTAGAGIAGART